MLLRAAAVGVLLLLAAPVVAGAEESFCPNGSSPRSDITFCSDFDALANCVTGSETSCWTDNHFPSAPAAQTGKIVSTGGAVGNGFVQTTLAPPGALGGGFNLLSGISGFPSSAIAFRYYMRFAGGYISFDAGGHNIEPESNGTNGCLGGVKLQLSTYSGMVYIPIGGTCGGISSYFVTENQGTYTPFLNNRWYLVEIHAVMDTSCTDSTIWNGCNGKLRVWKDGVLTHSYNNLNFGGVSASMQWGTNFLIPRVYNHYGNPPWPMRVELDNFVISNCSGGVGCGGSSPVIGAASGENSRGTGDPSSPYRSFAPYGAWIGRHAGEDCSSSGFGEYFWSTYRGSGALCPGDPVACSGTEPTHGTFTESCIRLVSDIPGLAGAGGPSNGTLIRVSDGTNGANGTTCTGGGSTERRCVYSAGSYLFTSITDNSVRAQVTSSSGGSGAVYERGDTYVFPQYASHGWVYLPSTNNYSVTNLALSGFTNTGNDPTAGYVAVSVSGGNWSVDQKNASGVHGSLVSGTAATFDTWHEYELILWNNGSGGCANANGCATLMIDRARLYTVQALPQSASWAFNGTQRPFSVVGVIDFQGTPTFTAYFDDSVVTTASAWSCDGWGAASCPFGGGAKFARGVKLSHGVKVQ